jgi:hypothetical protein
MRPADVVAPLAVAALTIAALAVPDNRRALLGAAAFVLVSAELLVLTGGFNAACDLAYYRPPLPIVEALHEHSKGEEPYRVVGQNWVFLPNASAQYHLEDIRGSDPMAWRPYLDFLELAAHPRQRHGVLRVTRFPQPVLDFLGVRYILAAPKASRPRAYTTVYSGPDGDLWHNPNALPRFFVPADVRGAVSRSQALKLCRGIPDFRRLAVLQEWTPPAALDQSAVRLTGVRRLTASEYALDVAASAPGVLVSSLPAAPGWRVSVDGEARALLVANSAFLAVQLEPGDHNLLIAYRPQSFTASLHLFGLGVALLLFVLVLTARSNATLPIDRS